MKSLVRIFPILACLFYSLHLKAADERVMQSLTGIAIHQAGTAPSLTVQDQWMSNLAYASWPTVFTVKNANVNVVLRFDDSQRRLNTLMSLQVTYDVKLYDGSNALIKTLHNQVLQINYTNASSYKDKDVLNYNGFFKAEVSIRAVAYSEAGGPSVPVVPAFRQNDIFLDVEQETERYYVLNTAVSPIVTQAVVQNNQLPLAWNYIQGAESYDLEWLFIDLGTDVSTDPNGFDLDFRDATRINTTDQHYYIPLGYPKGLIYFRVRPVGKSPATPDKGRVEGAWSFSNDSYVHNTNDQGIFPLNVPAQNCVYITAGLDIHYNWQYSAAYAEDGKRKEIIKYFDGSLRNRESVTLINSDNNAIIAQSKYDFQGRGAVQILPTPLTSTGIHYYSNFNDQFDKNAFDQDVNYRTPGPIPATEATAVYYGNDNTATGADMYIPDAGGYPYSRTLYRNDGTERIGVQSGVGSAHRIGSNHETRYYYGTPGSQEELDRLFGAEVGNWVHYKKNMVLDPNGQLSVSYIDQEGRTIATALSGLPPDNLLSLEPPPVPVSITTNLLKGKNAPSNDGTSAATTISVSTPGTYTFQYLLNKDSLCEPTCNIPCIDCVYDLTITVTDENDIAIIPAFTVSGISAYSYSFSVAFNKIGTYTISKVLTLNQSAVDQARQTFLTNQTCYTPATVNSGCLDCIGLCAAQYQLFDGNGNFLYYLDDTGHRLTDQTQGPILIATCQASCANASTVVPDECQQHRIVMLADMSPGGQYFDNIDQTSTATQSPSNLWLTDAIAADNDPTFWGAFNTYMTSTDAGACQQNTSSLSTWNQIRTNWNSCYAGFLIKYHPEYCLYSYFCLNKPCPGNIERPDPAITSQTMEDINVYGVNMSNDNSSAYNDPLNFPNTSFFDKPDITQIPSYQPWDPGKVDTYFSLECNPKYMDFNCGGTVVHISPVQQMYKFMKEFMASTGNTAAPAKVVMPIWYVLNDPGNISSILSTGIVSPAYYTYTPTGTTTPISIDPKVLDFFHQLHGDPGALAGSSQSYGLFGGPTPKSTPAQYFKNYYLACRNIILYKGLDGYTCPNNLSGSGAYLPEDPQHLGFTGGGFQIRWQKNSMYDTYLSTCQPFDPAQIASAFQSSASTSAPNFQLNCQSTCEGNADGWINQVQSTCTISASDLIDMRAYFVGICEGGCSMSAPGGSSSSPIAVNGNKGPMTTFAQVLSAYGCNTTTINYPTPAYDGNVCTCQNLSQFISNKFPNGATSLQIATVLNSSTSPAGTFVPADIDGWQAACANPTANAGALANLPTWLQCPGGASLPPDPPCAQANLNAQYQSASQFQILLNRVADQFVFDYKNRCLSTLPKREVFTMTYSLLEYQYTLYYYDQAGNLLKTVPPVGVAFLDVTSIPYTLGDVAAYRANPAGNLPRPPHKMVTNYFYNSLQQLTRQNTPDGGNTNFFYDALGRLVVSQNDKQLAASNATSNPPANVYSFTRYDELGRSAFAGELTSPTLLTNAISRDPNNFTSTTGNLLVDWVTNATSKRQITLTAYDESYPGLLTALPQEQLRNRIASVMYQEVFNPFGPYDNATHYSYDIHGNVKTLWQENRHLSIIQKDFNHLDYQYDLVSGNVNEVDYNLGNKDRFSHKYEYDADNRLVRAYTSRDGYIWEKECKDYYYKHGYLQRSETGDKEVQGSDYAYTIQGWMKGVNSDVLDPSKDPGKDGYGSSSLNPNLNFTQDASAYNLHYFQGDYLAKNAAYMIPVNSFETNTFGFTPNATFQNLYNGNISAMATAHVDVNTNQVSPQLISYRYDQLNRIRLATASLGRVGGGGWDGTTIQNNSEEFHYDGNGNIDRVYRNGNNSSANLLAMDNFTYNYYTKTGVQQAISVSLAPGDEFTNKLAYVDDDINITGNYTTDLDKQNSSNYAYDNIGNLVQDLQSDIDNSQGGKIEWTVCRKVQRITHNSTSVLSDLEFVYDANGNRIEKIVKPHFASTDGGYPGIKPQQNWTYTYYVRDAKGNVITTYTRGFNSLGGGNYNDSYQVKEQDIYTSRRIGLRDGLDIPVDTYQFGAAYNVNTSGEFVFINQSYTFPLPVLSTEVRLSRTLGHKTYELSNHIENVLATISDRKIGVGTGGLLSYYSPEVKSYSDYYAFGAPMPGRNFNLGAYKYQFNGKECDPEVFGQGNEEDFGARMYDPRLGRWLSCDPSFNKYPGYSPYTFSFDSPIKFNDPDGKDPFEAGKEINVNLNTFRVVSQKDVAKWKNDLSNLRDPKLFNKAFLTQEARDQLMGGPFEAVGLGEIGKAAIKKMDEKAKEFDEAMDAFQGAAYSDKYTLRDYGTSADDFSSKLTDRTVENLGKGFEASVTSKSEYDVAYSQNKDGVFSAELTKTKDTFYSLNTTKDKSGNITKQVWEVSSITYDKNGTGTFKREADVVAKPVDKNHK
jgi:RHS repeat-associated protein